MSKKTVETEIMEQAENIIAPQDEPIAPIEAPEAPADSPEEPSEETTEEDNAAVDPEETMPDEDVPVLVDFTQVGIVRGKIKVSTGNCADYPVTFDVPFAEDHEPVVVVGFVSSSTAARFGTCACAIVDGSVTNEGFTIRFYNGDTSSRIPGFSFIAHGVVEAEPAE